MLRTAADAVAAEVADSHGDAAGADEIRIVGGVMAQATLPASIAVSSSTLPRQALFSAFDPATGHVGRAGQQGTSHNLSVTVSDPEAEWWRPSVTYTLEREWSRAALQYDVATPTAADARSTLAAHNVIAGWAAGDWRLGYRASSSSEQSSEANASDDPVSRSRGHGGYFGVLLAERLDLQADWGRDTVRDRLSAQATRWTTVGVAAQWSYTRRLSLRSGLTESRSSAGELIPAMSSRTAAMTLSYALDGGAEGDGEAASHAYVRLDQQTLKGAGLTFSPDLPQVQRSVSVGILLSF